MSTFNSIKLHIIEDHYLMRAEIEALFTADARFEVVSISSNVAEALGVINTPCDVVLLDLQLPDGSGLELIPHIRATSSLTKILILTVHQDASHAMQAMEYGVDGYVMKDDVDLADRVVAVAAGEHPVDSRITGYLMARVALDKPVQNHGLTPRELETLMGLYQGMSYVELAAHLHVSSHTIPGYIKNLYRKLGVSSRSQAVYKATQIGLLHS